MSGFSYNRLGVALGALVLVGIGVGTGVVIGPPPFCRRCRATAAP